VDGNEPVEQEAVYEAGNLLATLQAGFTTVQTLGAPVDKTVRDAINAGALPGPRVLTSIHQIHGNSGDPAKLRELVRQWKAEGADVIRSSLARASAPTWTGAPRNPWTVSKIQLQRELQNARIVGGLDLAVIRSAQIGNEHCKARLASR
jgi:hypothetical protein